MKLLMACKVKKSCKNKHLGESVKAKKIDAGSKKLHNLVSLLLTNTTLCWDAKCLKHDAKQDWFFKN
jgi:hypothetical protein